MLAQQYEKSEFDGDAEDNVDQKWLFIYLIISWYSKVIYFVYQCQTITKLNLEYSDNFEIEINKFAVVVHVLQKTQSLVILRCFPEERQRNVSRFTTHVHSYCSAH